MSLIRKMSHGIGLPESYLINLARSASHRYKTYRIPKRSGGERTIHHPSKELKAVQRWLLRYVVSDFPVHEAAMAYRTNVGIRMNALAHAGSRYLLRVDIRDFFPSITADDIAGLLHQERPDWAEVDNEFFVALVCRERILTIGAPTSPALSNSVCHDLDTRLSATVKQRGVAYTRYADDLFFSTRRSGVMWDIPELVEALLRELPIPSRLRVHPEKTRHSSMRGKRQVTGLVLTPRGRVTIGRERKRKIRAMIHQYEALSPVARRELAGLLAFAKGVEPDFINALIVKYGKADVDRARQMEPIDDERDFT